MLHRLPSVAVRRLHGPLANIGAWAIRYGRWALVAIALCSAACRGQPAEDPARFIPPEAAARQALTAVLESWRADEPPPSKAGEIEILLVDAWRRDGRKIDDFRILGAQPWDRGRRFVVELQLRDETEPLRVRYVVVGIQPLIVFRQEDFDMLANWMHPMDSDGAAAAPSADSAAPSDPSSSDTPESGAKP